MAFRRLRRYSRSATVKATASLPGTVTVARPWLSTVTVGPEQVLPVRLPWMTSQ